MEEIEAFDSNLGDTKKAKKPIIDGKRSKAADDGARVVNPL